MGLFSQLCSWRKVWPSRCAPKCSVVGFVSLKHTISYDVVSLFHIFKPNVYYMVVFLCTVLFPKKNTDHQCRLTKALYKSVVWNTWFRLLRLCIYLSECHWYSFYILCCIQVQENADHQGVHASTLWQVCMLSFVSGHNFLHERHNTVESSVHEVSNRTYMCDYRWMILEARSQGGQVFNARLVLFFLKLSWVRCVIIRKRRFHHLITAPGKPGWLQLARTSVATYGVHEARRFSLMTIMLVVVVFDERTDKWTKPAQCLLIMSLHSNALP